MNNNKSKSKRLIEALISEDEGMAQTNKIYVLLVGEDGEDACVAAKSLEGIKNFIIEISGYSSEEAEEMAQVLANNGEEDFQVEKPSGEVYGTIAVLKRVTLAN